MRIFVSRTTVLQPPYAIRHFPIKTVVNGSEKDSFWLSSVLKSLSTRLVIEGIHLSQQFHIPKRRCDPARHFTEQSDRYFRELIDRKSHSNAPVPGRASRRQLIMNLRQSIDLESKAGPPRDPKLCDTPETSCNTWRAYVTARNVVCDGCAKCSSINLFRVG